MNERIRELLQKYQKNSISKKEYEELLAYFRTEKDEEAAGELHKLIEIPVELLPAEEKRIAKITSAAEDRLKQRILQKPARKRKWRSLWPYAAAAVVLFLVAGLIYQETFKNNRMKNDIPAFTDKDYGEDLPPGGTRAVVILDDGRTIELDSLRPEIQSSAQGLAYADGAPVTGTELTKNYTIRTPNGGQYSLLLPDGTKVILNAASSISYPSRFEGDKRLVRINGEAYFDVNHDASHPFIVEGGRQTVEVLGTEFNINAYEDEPLAAVTLVRGSVRLSDARTSVKKILKPGQQGVSSAHGLEIQNVDTEIYSAWKDGYFVFDGTELGEVLRQLSRWYDVEVDQRGIPDRQLNARIKRDKNISSVLRAISKTTGIEFYVKGRRLQER